MKIVPPAQYGKQATFSPKQCSQSGKATLEIRSVLCLKKLFLRSAAPVVAWHRLYLESFNWWAEVTTPSTAYAWLIESTAVCWPTLPLEHYTSWQRWPLWLLNPRGLWRKWPGSHKTLDTGWIKPQFYSDFNTDEGDLHQSHMALEVICWMTDVSLWCPASSFHISRPTQSSTLFPGVSDC